jgi:integrase/recombinase XerD
MQIVCSPLKFAYAMKQNKDMDLSPLMTYPIDKITLSAILDTRREKAEGYYPVKMRITADRKQIYYPCIDILPEDYSDLHKADIRRKDLTDNKKLILASFDNMKKNIQELVKEGNFSIDLLNKRLSKGRKDSVITAFDNRIEKLDKAGKVGSSVWYTCARNSIKEFIGDSDLKFSGVTVSWLTDYEAHLTEGKKKDSTISINMRALRAIINEAKADGIISESQYPFEIKKNGKYAIPDGGGTKRALTEAQLYDVFDYPLSPVDEKFRDLWIFSFYCNGANFSDILRFRYKNIKNGGIEWYRQKTKSTDKKKIEIRAIITEEMKQVIDKYGNNDRRPNNFIFPFLSDGLSPLQERMIIQNLIHTINKRMKRIGRALGIGDITTYWCRHSYASIARRKDIKLFAISKSLGHKSLATTQIYLDSLPDDELMENAMKMPRRIKK